ncbi:MAG TPA: hypothetical protein VF598_01475 [Hymenobacter sp.]
MLPNRLLVASLFMLFVGAGSAVQAQTTAPADSFQSPAKQQLNTLPPATRPGAPLYPMPTRNQVLETPPPLTLGLSLGWGAPYAMGVEMAYRFRPALDGNVGVGLGSSGAKIGAGFRAFVPSRSRSQLFVGTNLVYSYSEAEVTIDDNGVKGRYLVHSSALLHLRAGLHRQFRRNALQLALGYGAVLSPNPTVELVPGYGPGSATAQRIVELVGPGGLEVSVSFLIGLGRSTMAVR